MQKIIPRECLAAYPVHLIPSPPKNTIVKCQLQKSISTTSTVYIKTDCMLVYDTYAVCSRSRGHKVQGSKLPVVMHVFLFLFLFF